jgi:hypothetical protein
VIAADQVAVISTRDVLLSHGGNPTAATRDIILQEALQSMQMQSANVADDAAARDAILSDALKALDCKGNGSDLD